MKKINNILLSIFSIGILISLTLGALTFVGYIIAMILGGDTATQMCYTILKVVMPWVIKSTSVFVGIGLLAMYLTKQNALTTKVKKEK